METAEMNPFYIRRQLGLTAGYLGQGRLSAARDCLLRALDALNHAIALADPSDAEAIAGSPFCEADLEAIFAD
jgi:hypothetical protein